MNSVRLHDARKITGLNRNKLNALVGLVLLIQQIALFRHTIHSLDEERADLANVDSVKICECVGLTSFSSFLTSFFKLLAQLAHRKVTAQRQTHKSLFLFIGDTFFQEIRPLYRVTHVLGSYP